VLPAAPLAEGDGTLVNNEGRAQRFYQVFAPKGAIQESWRWLRDLARAAGRAELSAWEDLAAVQQALGEALPALGAARWSARALAARTVRIPRAPHRYSGRTAMLANVDVHEPRPPQDPDSPLAFSMEGQVSEDSAVIPFFWSPGWNSVQSLNKFQHEVGGPLRGGDPGVRLIEPRDAAAAGRREADVAPPAFRRREREWLVIPLHHVFGSEELSAIAPAVAERVPAPYLALGGEDAAALGVRAGDAVEMSGTGAPLRLPVAVRADLPAGVAGLPAGLPSLPFARLPQWARIARCADD
jgi:NADH-quinone oxidoreductase subunit G